MNGAVALAAAVSLIAQANGIPRKVVCLCCYCVNVVDPLWEAPTRRAPDSAECERCGSPEDWKRAGLCFVVLPANF